MRANVASTAELSRHVADERDRRRRRRARASRRRSPARMSSTATRAPSAASRRQIDPPMPAPPPVTTASLPSRFISCPPLREPRRRGRARRRPRAARRRRAPRRARRARPRCCTHAGARELDDLGELGARPPVREARPAVSNGIAPKRNGSVPPPTPMIGDVPARRDAGGGQLERRVDADAVDHQRGAAPARGVRGRPPRVRPVGLQRRRRRRRRAPRRARPRGGRPPRCGIRSTPAATGRRRGRGHRRR